MTPRNRRFASLAGLLVAAAVTFVSVLTVNADTAPSTKDPLVLNGHSPRTVELSINLSTGGSLRTSGTIGIDFASSSLRAQLEVPMLTAATAFSVRAINHRLYLTSPNLDNAAGPVWYTLGVKWPSITSLARYLVKPNVALLTLLANARITHSGYSTTYEFQESHVALGTLGKAKAAGATGHLSVRLSTGRQGEVTGAWASLVSPSATTTVSLRVLSYNHPLTITAPPSSQPTTSASPLISQLLSTGALGALILPAQWLHLFQRAKSS